MEITTEFKQKIRQAMLDNRKRYEGADTQYARAMGINGSVYNRIKKGETDKVMKSGDWIRIARELEVELVASTWKLAKTSVYLEIEENLNFCKTHSRSMLLVDDCGIGKTVCAKAIVQRMPNAYYIDCSQAKTKQVFVRLLAKKLGVSNTGRYVDVKADLKYYINIMNTPLIVLDEAGDLDYNAFLELKELWNATTGVCAWYMMGADGLRSKIERGIQNRKVGYAEIFSRFSDDFVKLVPVGTDDRKAYYRHLLTQIAAVNISDKTIIKKAVNKCLLEDKSLRYLETFAKIATA